MTSALGIASSSARGGGATLADPMPALFHVPVRPIRQRAPIRRLKVLAWASAFTVLCAGAVAQAAEPAPWVARHYGSTDGLPVSSASTAAIDAQGFLWLATHDGLARFDGREFTIFDAAQFPVLGGSRFRTLHADRAHTVHALGAGGEWVRLRAGTIERVGEPPGLRVREIQRLPQLCVSADSGLHCVAEDGLSWRQRRAFAPGEDVRLALADGDADWLVVQGTGLRHCRATECRTVWHSREPLQSGAAGQVHLLSAGRLLIALPSGLLSARPGLPAEWVRRRPDGAVLRDIIQLREDSELGIMAGTAEGLYRVEGTTATALPDLPAEGISRISQAWRAPDSALWRSVGGALYREAQPLLKSRGTVTDVTFGKDGSAFITTLRDGFYVLTQPRIELLGQAGSPLAGGNLYGMAMDHAGAVWLGSLGDGLLRLLPGGALRRYGPEHGLPGQNTWVVLADVRRRRVLVAPYQPGLWLWEESLDRFVPLALPPPLQAAPIRSLSVDRAGLVWAAGEAGAWQEQADGTWQQRWPAPGAPPVLVLAIAHATAGTTWYGGNRGLWRQTADGTVTAIATNVLGDTPVRGLYLGGDGTLWVCTEGRGLLRIAADDPTGARPRRLGRAEGLPSNSPHAVLEDATGALWINSNQGIFRLTPDALAEFLDGRTSLLSPLTLGLADGLTELEGNGGVQPAALTDPLGRFWFPSQRGVVRFDPSRLPLRRVAPQAVIDGLDHEGQSLDVSALALPLGVRTLQFRYNAADLHAASQVRFRYRLTPLEQRWTEAGERRVAAFAALAPGRYQFEVRAGNGDGFWATTPAVQAFTVPPFWYESNAARFALLLAAALGAAGLAHWRVQRLRQRARQLDAQVQVRTQELRAEKQRVESTLDELAMIHDELARTHREIERRNHLLAEQATRLEALDRFRTRLLADVSHELRTPLMLIRLPLKELAGASSALSERDRKRITLPLQQTERLAHLVEQLVGLVRAEAGQLRLRLRRLDLVLWTGRLLGGFQPLAESAGVQLELQAASGLQPVYADPDQLATVVGNLLDNALKFSPRGSTVQLGLIAVDDREIEIHVRDQGPGFDPELSAQLFERFFRAEGPPRAGREGLGIGLALARELVGLHGGSIGARRRAAGGAEFWVRLPLGNAHVALDELTLDAAPETVHGALLHPDAQVPTAAVATGCLLLVEDHPELAAYLGERLAEHYPVEVAGDAESAWQRLSAGGVRLLVSDVVLPGMDGIALCTQVRAASEAALAELPIVLVSAKAGADGRERGLAAGANDWLGKPFSLEQLLERLAPLWPAPRSPAQDVPATAGAEPADTTLSAAAAPEDPLLQLALAQLTDATFGVAEWTARAHLSERQLRRRVAELTGQAPVVWLREQRLQRVRELVGSGRCRTLAQAGHQSGFDNPGYLYRLYRARYGDG